MVQAPSAEVEAPPSTGGDIVSTLDAELSGFNTREDMVAFYRDNYTLERLEAILGYLANGGLRADLSSQLRGIEASIAHWESSATYTRKPFHSGLVKSSLDGGLAKADEMRILMNEKEKLESRLGAVEKAYDETAGHVRRAIEDKELAESAGRKQRPAARSGVIEPVSATSSAGGLVRVVNTFPREILVRSSSSGGHEPMVYTHDEDGILLEPDEEKGEIAVLNPAVHQHNREGPWPFPYRVIMKDDAGEYSEIHFRMLKPPTKLSKESRPLITREYEWECRGCEDPRLTKIGDLYAITYTAYDGVNARVALAVTRDFVHVKKLGPIGPEIPLEEAVKLVPESRYRRVWEEGLKDGTYKENGRGRKVPIVLGNKDAAVYFEDGWYVLNLRLDPDMHVIRVRELEQLRDQKLWRTFIRNIMRHKFIEAKEPWCRKKVGWGDAKTTVYKGKHIGLYHGVDDELRYSGSFYERHPRDPTKAVAIMGDPLFVPDSDMYRFEHPNAKGDKEVKMVAFPSGIIIQGNVLWTYMGIADNKIGYRSTSVEWVERELEHNRCA